MRPRTLLILFAVVAGLASFIWFVERDLPGSDERAERAKRLVGLESEAITRLEIESGGQRVVLARRPEGGWDLVEPLAARAVEGAVEALLDQLVGLEKERTFTEGSAAELGLVPPRAEITLGGKAGEVRFLVGGQVPASDSMVVAAGPAGPFHVVPKVEEGALERRPNDWRSRTIFPHLRDEIVRLTLERGEELLAIAKRGDDYFLEAPLEDRADLGTVSRFIDALVGLEATEFIDDPSRHEGEFDAAPRRVLVVETTAGGTPWRLALGRSIAGAAEEEPGAIALRADGHVYLAEDRFGEDFARGAEGWRSLEWGAGEVFAMERLEIRDAIGALVLERDAGDWLRDGVKVEYSPVSDLLYAIAGTKGEALGAEQAVAGAPLVTVTINPGDAAQVLRIFGPTGDRYPATASDRAAALWLGGDRVRSILSKIADVRAAAEVGTPADEAAPESPAASAPGD